MDFSTGQSVCKRCKYGQQQDEKIYINPMAMMQKLVIQFPKELRIVITIAYFFIFTLLLGVSIYTTIRYRVFLLYIPTAMYTLFGIIFYILFIKKKSHEN
jgi:hypothetical protein